MQEFGVEPTANNCINLATSTLHDDCFLPFDLPAICRKKLSANFDGGALSSEGRLLLKHPARCIRRHWPKTLITFRGDSHYGRPEAMEWCEANGAGYIVTSLLGAARHFYEKVCCERGQARNLIKMHKVQLAYDRTSCQSAIANQVPLSFISVPIG